MGYLDWLQLQFANNKNTVIRLFVWEMLKQKLALLNQFGFHLLILFGMMNKKIHLREILDFCPFQARNVDMAFFQKLVWFVCITQYNNIQLSPTHIY